MYCLRTLQMHERKCLAPVSIEDEQCWDTVDPSELVGERLSSLDQRELRFRAGKKLLHAFAAFVVGSILEPIDGDDCNVFFITAFAHRIQGFELPSAGRAPTGKKRHDADLSLSIAEGLRSDCRQRAERVAEALIELQGCAGVRCCLQTDEQCKCKSQYSHRDGLSVLVPISRTNNFVAGVPLLARATMCDLRNHRGPPL